MSVIYYLSHYVLFKSGILSIENNEKILLVNGNFIFIFIEPFLFHVLQNVSDWQ